MRNRSTSTSFPCIVLGLTLLAAGSVWALERTEQQRIEDAIRAVATSDLVFIRNGEEVDGKRAADHLRLKLKNAGERIRTFDDFVDRVATKSSISGTPYLVKIKDGNTQELSSWIRQQDKAAGAG
ncbi:MAG: DUF5329 family protein [Tepidisphaeraceae bacterium]